MAQHVKVSDAHPQVGEYILFPKDFEDIEKKVRRLNKKTIKQGGTPASITVVREAYLPLYKGKEKTQRMIQVVVVRPEGELFKMHDYRLVATLEHTEAGNIIRKAPGFEDFDVKAYRNAPAYCEHCKTIRDRKDTFVLDGPQGRMQVGRNCLADFLRDHEMASILGFSGVLAAFAEVTGGSELGFYSGCGEEGYNFDVFLATAHRSVRKYGFRRSGEEGSTRSDVLFALGPAPAGSSYQAWEKAQPTKEDVEGAEEIKTFVEGLEGDSDYVHNLKVAFARGFVGRRSEGLVASAAGIYFKDKGEKAAKAKALDEHYGEPKKRYDLTLVVKRIHCFDTPYGEKEILVLSDDEGRTFVWKTSPTDFEVGDRLSGKGTVKDHDVYKGYKQTTLSRCKFTQSKDSEG